MLSLNKIFLLDNEKKEITKNGKYIKLTAAEFEVLSLLLKREGFIISREDIFDNSKHLQNDNNKETKAPSKLK